MDHPGQLFYYVACRRRDGLWPGLHKAMYDRLFLDKQEAEDFADVQNRSLNMKDNILVFASVAYPYEEEQDDTQK